MNDTESPPVAWDPNPGPESQPRVARHFRQIVLWPIQVLRTKKDGRRETADAQFERLADGHWDLVDDEFGIQGAFQERHYREFVSFLPHVQRFLYGDAPGPVRGLGRGDAPLRVYRRTDIGALRITLDKGREPITCGVAHIDLHFFHDVDAVILACEFFASNLPLAAVHEIMYRFGRAYPPGWTESGEPLHCPARVEWLDKSGNVLATSDYEDRDRYLTFVGHHRAPCFAAHWEFLLKPLRAEHSVKGAPLSFRQIEYYRMPVMTYLTLDRLWDLKRVDFMRLAFATGPSSNGGAPYAERFLHAADERR